MRNTPFHLLERFIDVRHVIFNDTSTSLSSAINCFGITSRSERVRAISLLRHWGDSRRLARQVKAFCLFTRLCCCPSCITHYPYREVAILEYIGEDYGTSCIASEWPLPRKDCSLTLNDCLQFIPSDVSVLLTAIIGRISRCATTFESFFLLLLLLLFPLAVYYQSVVLVKIWPPNLPKGFYERFWSM